MQNISEMIGYGKNEFTSLRKISFVLLLLKDLAYLLVLPHLSDLNFAILLFLFMW